MDILLPFILGSVCDKSYPSKGTDSIRVWPEAFSVDKLVFLLDGNLCYQFDKKEGEAWPFDKPYYLILNVAYGGWGGSCGMDDSAFPCEMKVDWIRYYKLKE